jgi:molybdopterin synthase catalytic subunit/molybdopterin converting factor small subunit
VGQIFSERQFLDACSTDAVFRRFCGEGSEDELSFCVEAVRLAPPMASMKITLKLFGSLREAAGESTLQVDLEEGALVADVRNWLAERNPLVDKLGDRLAASVNLEIADLGDVLADGDEVAFLPPVAGGDGSGSTGGEQSVKRCTISDLALDEQEVAARVEGPDAGGVVSFIGRVRNHARGQSIEHLEYEAYPEMAEREMEKIADEAGEKWPGTRVAIAHRVGHLEIGDAAVVVVAASAHRGEAFEACRFAIDTLKVTVPIWKREVATDGAYWVDDHA